MVYREKDRADGKADRPIITSYDSGYEHGLEHLILVRSLVEEAAEEVTVKEAPAAYAIPGVAA
jgi:hypothetical protein